MKLIVSSCCEAKLKFVGRKPKTPALFNPETGWMIKSRVLGKRVRAYVCAKCGKCDR